MRKLLFLLIIFISFIKINEVKAENSLIIWENTDIIVSVNDNIDNYANIPKAYVYENGVKKELSYFIGVEGTSLSSVSTTIIDKYVVIYEVSYDNYISRKEITFHVVDNISPSLTNNPTELNILVNSKNEVNYLEGIYVKDNYCTEEEIKISYDASNVNYNQIGSYLVYYSISDTSNNVYNFYRTINVIDNISPKIICSKPLYINIDSKEINYYYNIDITDNYDNNPTLIVDSSNVLINKVGHYIIKYIGYDDSLNEIVFEREAIVIDNISPTITLKKYYIEVDINNLPSNGFIKNNIENVSDNLTALSSKDVKFINEVKTEYGTYKIIYYVFDEYDNYSEVILNVWVKDFIPPEINGEGKNLLLNTSFDPLSYVQAIDNIDGNITDKLIIEYSNVDTNVEGLYKVTYSVYDSSGNYRVKDIYYNVTSVHDYKYEEVNTTEIPDVTYSDNSTNQIKDKTAKTNNIVPIIVFSSGIILFIIVKIVIKIKKMHSL